MIHAEFIAIMAVERYLLGELTGEEREAFEEHFFDCPECASDVHAGEVMMASGRVVAREDKR